MNRIKLLAATLVVCAYGGTANAQDFEGHPHSMGDVKVNCDEYQKGTWHCSDSPIIVDPNPDKCKPVEGGGWKCTDKKNTSHRDEIQNRYNDDTHRERGDTMPRECMPSMDKPTSPYC